MDALERQWHNDKAAAELLERIEVNPETGCFEWAGSINPKGYGIMTYARKTRLAHRVAWMVENGPIPDDDNPRTQTCVLHKCDNPKCVNTAHLFLGTRRDNMLDMYAKGRGQHQDPNKERVVKSRGLDVYC